ncbi:MAG: enoyl-CoA hydratase/isomerase family protein, partial [Spirochaetales bacterium]|nr:enoyl-CoA hydratase/isomerase family protein [Spirochaetales bacterium]
ALLEKALDELGGNKDIRIIFLRSSGKHFCLGMDLQKAAENAGKDNTGSAVEKYSHVLDMLHNSPKITISLVNGSVKAGGVGLTSACDMVFCTQKADFELSEALFGLLPANVLPYLYMLRLSPQKARYLVLTARKVDAKEAVQLGLAEEMFSENEFENKTRQIARQLLRIAPSAVGEYKKFSMDFLEKGFSERKRQAIETIKRLLADKTVMNTICDFNEGSTPAWFAKFRPEHSISGITEEE